MGYDRGHSFPFYFKPNGTPFGSKLEGKLSPRSYPIQCERKCKHSFLSVIFKKMSISLLIDLPPQHKLTKIELSTQKFEIPIAAK